MAVTLLAAFAHIVARRRRWIIGAWIVLTLFGAFSASQVSKRWYQSFSIPGKQAYEANQRTFKAFNTGIRPPNVIVFHASGDATTNNGIRDAMTRVAQTYPSDRTSSFFSTHNPMYVSQDRRTTFMEVYPSGLANFSSKSGATDMLNVARKGLPAGVTVNVTGHDPLEEASSHGSSGGGSVLVELNVDNPGG